MSPLEQAIDALDNLSNDNVTPEDILVAYLRSTEQWQIACAYERAKSRFKSPEYLPQRDR